MPAHRSEAEAEIREAVVSKLQHIRPNARIIHEINAGGGINRIDVMAVDPAEIITVEIKSERDKLDRLPTQIATMSRCSHHYIAALHRKFMPEVTNYGVPCIEGVDLGTIYWYYPSAQDMAEAHHDAFSWADPDIGASLNVPLPEGAIHLLWRDELMELCGELGLAMRSNARMREMIRALQWAGSGRDLTRGVCRALRRRSQCAEADPVIEDAA